MILSVFASVKTTTIIIIIKTITTTIIIINGICTAPIFHTR